MLVFVILAVSTVLTAFWLMMLLAVSREDWAAAAQNKCVDNLMKIEDLQRQDAKRAAALRQYHGLPRKVMGIFLDRDSRREIAKLEKTNQALSGGRTTGLSIFEMPGYSIQRLIPAVGEGMLYHNILDKCLELYGKKYGRNKAVQVIAQVSSYSVIGIAASLAVGSICCRLVSPLTGLMTLGMGSLVVIILSRSYYNQIGEDLAKRRTAIARQFPNVVSKMALLVMSGMTVDRAWRVTAGSQTLELYQEMRKTSDELDRSVPSEEAYTNFINRCNTKETTKLASAIIQSITKSPAEIGHMLKGMSHDAWEERQHTARRDAENANSRLLIPTMMLFIAIMIMIMVPIGLELGGMG